jgi:phospholipase/carboxylesterase
MALQRTGARIVNRLHERSPVTKIVNGASRQPLSGGPPRQIVLLLHGYGSRGSDLIAFIPPWQQLLPDALFVAPNAPQVGGWRAGYQWFPLTGFSPAALAAGAASAAAPIEAFIDRKLTQYGLGEADMAIVGFSQGTMMALHVGLRRKEPVAAIVGYSGMLTGAAELAHQRIVKPPVLLVHGSADPVVPVAAIHAAEHALRRAGVPVTAHVSPGVGHFVDPLGLRMGAQFIADAFAGAKG